MLHGIKPHPLEDRGTSPLLRLRNRTRLQPLTVPKVKNSNHIKYRRREINESRINGRNASSQKTHLRRKARPTIHTLRRKGKPPRLMRKEKERRKCSATEGPLARSSFLMAPPCRGKGTHRKGSSARNKEKREIIKVLQNFAAPRGESPEWARLRESRFKTFKQESRQRGTSDVELPAL